MTRLLQDRYDSQKEPGKHLPSIRFGQSPESRSEVFSKFTKTIYNAARNDTRPSLATGGRLKTMTDHFNVIAKDSLADMQPFGDEDLSDLDTDFPVEVEGKNDRVGSAGDGSASSGSAEFNFNFTPVREV